jgi:signal transduction histidine kinase
VLVDAAVFPGRDEGVAIVIDLSERKAQEQFEQEFLAGIAHDLKNPLAAMKAQAQLMRRRLRGGRLTAQVADEGLTAIELNVNRVARRIEELMDIALLRSGRALDLFREPVDLVTVANGRAETYRQTTERHRIEVDVVDRPLIGNWDVNRIERALDNLFSNAIKYSPGGGEIVVRLERVEEPGVVWAVCSISDQGVGIPSGDLPHVFTKFRRGSNVQGRMRGTGIGLSGVSMLVEQHGGTIEAVSREGAGSTFILRLPLAD